jgi:hypothetical protein
MYQTTVSLKNINKYAIKKELLEKYNTHPIKSVKKYLTCSKAFDDFFESIELITKKTNHMRIMKELNKFYYDNFVHKVDVFSLGVVMLEVLSYVDEDRFNQCDKMIYLRYKELAHKAMLMNPIERYDIEQVLRGFNKIRKVYQNVDSPTIQKCMKLYTKTELINIIERKRLPSSLKRLKKYEICKSIVPYITK